MVYLMSTEPGYSRVLVVGHSLLAKVGDGCVFVASCEFSGLPQRGPLM